MQSRDNRTNRTRNARPKVIALVAVLIQGTAAAVIGIVCTVGLVCSSFQAGTPGPEDPPGSGIVVQTEVTALWIPRALRDVAQGEAGAPILPCPQALQTEPERRSLTDAWYAVSYRSYQVNGDCAEITQVRRISEACSHVEEFQNVMAMAAGNPPYYEGRELSPVKVEIIPDTLLTANPLWVCGPASPCMEPVCHVNR